MNSKARVGISYGLLWLKEWFLQDSEVLGGHLRCWKDKPVVSLASQRARWSCLEQSSLCSTSLSGSFLRSYLKWTYRTCSLPSRSWFGASVTSCFSVPPLEWYNKKHLVFAYHFYPKPPDPSPSLSKQTKFKCIVDWINEYSLGFTLILRNRVNGSSY